MKNYRPATILACAMMLSLSVAYSAVSAQAPPDTGQSAQQNVSSESNRQALPRDGGAPAQALKAYFAARGHRDWQAIKALTPSEIRSMMEEDEADGNHLLILDGMASSSPREIEIVEGWIEDGEVAHVRYRGRVGDDAIVGHAELVLENGEWLVAVAGIGQ